jgi:hypothetical protein
METVLLVTDDHRLPAIRTYLSTGFRPCPHSWDWTHRPRWTNVRRALKMAAPACSDRAHGAWIPRIG